MSDADTERIDGEALGAFGHEVFTATGLDSASATVLADALVSASLRGIDTHGIVRVDPYSRKLDQGGYNPSPIPTVSTRSDSVAVLDADEGPGPVAADRAMEESVAMAKRTGVGATVVTNSNHFGMAAYYTLYAADEDCLGLAMSHGGPRVAPFGGVDPFFGTNPIAYSVPTDREFDITLDMSTSASANAKIRRARERGEPIPDDWAVDGSGASTTDPSAVHALQPLGGAKGYGLGLLVELCTGLLAGTVFAPEVNTPFDDYSKPMRIGHYLLALDIDAFRDVEVFKTDVGELIDRLKSVRTADGVDEVRLPGERAARTAVERERDGIPVDRTTRERLAAVGEKYGVDFPY